jgi:hypothetical protein
MNRKNIVELLKNEFDFGELRDFLLYNEDENERVGDSQRDITIYENEEYELIYIIMRDKHILRKYTKNTGEIDTLFVIRVDWEV